MKRYPSLCGICRPGGTELTMSGIRLSGIKERSSVLDIGCGEGETVRFLRDLGYQAVGVDPRVSPEPEDASADGSMLVCARAEDLPFQDESFDAVLCECVLSDVEEPDQMLLETARVLKEGGSLILSDLYARKEPAYAGVRPEHTEMIRRRLNEAGFDIREEKDCSDLLISFFGQFMMDGRTDELKGSGLDEKAMRRAGCGYILMTAKKR